MDKFPFPCKNGITQTPLSDHVRNACAPSKDAEVKSEEKRIVASAHCTSSGGGGGLDAAGRVTKMLARAPRPRMFVVSIVFLRISLAALGSCLFADSK